MILFHKIFITKKFIYSKNSMEIIGNNTSFEDIFKTDKEKIKKFLDIWKKYNFFVVSSDKSRYMNLGWLWMLAFCIQNIENNQLQEILEKCMIQWKFDIKKFSDIFRIIYEEKLSSGDSFEKLNNAVLETEIDFSENYDTSTLWVFTPNMMFLPEWYQVCKTEFWDQWINTNPFHTILEEKISWYKEKEPHKSIDLIIYNKSNIMNDLVLWTNEQQFLQNNKDKLKKMSHILESIAQYSFEIQKAIFMSLMEMDVSDDMIKNLNEQFDKWVTSWDYFEFIKMLYEWGINYATTLENSPTSTMQINALKSDIERFSKLHNDGELIGIERIQIPNVFIAPKWINWFCNFVWENKTTSFGKVVGTL